MQVPSPALTSDCQLSKNMDERSCQSVHYYIGLELTFTIGYTQHHELPLFDLPNSTM
jgi:hypothetical protein